MDAVALAKTNDRSVMGSMNDFVFMAEAGRAQGGVDDLVELSVWLAGTPCSPLRKGTGFPDLELRSVVAAANG